MDGLHRMRRLLNACIFRIPAFCTERQTTTTRASVLLVNGTVPCYFAVLAMCAFLIER